MKHILLLILVVLVNQYSLGQGQSNNWLFGEYAGINFNTSPPTVFNNSKLFSEEGCAAISDASGNLLFYTNGETVWNKTHNVMLNGSGLYGHTSSTQAALIIKDPYSDTEYYIFTTDHIFGARGLCYSKVDMSLNSGLGGITLKNIKLIGNTGEKVTAVPHKNGKDFWVLTKEKTDNKYYAFLVNSAGVNINPVISAVGNFIGVASNPGIGAMKVSPDYSKVAVADYGGGLELFDFDNTIGELSNGKYLYSSFQYQMYSVEFSPNSKMLYVSAIPVFVTDSGEIWQYDVSVNNLLSIISSKQVVTTFTRPFISCAIQIANDGRIYIAVYNSATISVIDKPDNKGKNCNVIHNYVDISPGVSILGLPSLYIDYVNPQKKTISVQNRCFKDTTLFKLVSATSVFSYDSLLWDFGDPATVELNYSKNSSSAHIFSSSATYTVKVIMYNDTHTDTLSTEVKIEPFPQFSLGTDTIICSNDSIKLTGPSGSDEYFWSTTDVSKSIMVKNKGNYLLTVTQAGCAYTDTIFVDVKLKPTLNVGKDTIICEGESAVIGKIINGALTYLWEPRGETTPQITVSSPANYVVEVFDGICRVEDTLKVELYTSPDIWLGNDTIICGTDEYLLDGGNNVNTQYIWQDGSKTRYYRVTQTGDYIINTAPHRCGQVSDTIHITFLKELCDLHVPTAFSPNGDGRNDVFFPIGYQAEIENMKIYNRWGELLFDGVTPWDGTYQGEPVPAGNYLYVITYKKEHRGGKKRVFTKGTVLIIR